MLALVVVLVGVALAYAVSYLQQGGGGDATTTTRPTRPVTLSSSPPVPVSTSAPPPVAAADLFASPSGNIGCAIDEATARCDVLDRAWVPPPQPPECTLTWGQGVQVTADGAGIVCAADSLVGAGGELGYGQERQRGMFSCLSEETGVTCTDTVTGRGFSVSRDTYALF